jgi:hypothetical protein
MPDVGSEMSDFGCHIADIEMPISDVSHPTSIFRRQMSDGSEVVSLVNILVVKHAIHNPEAANCSVL